MPDALPELNLDAISDPATRQAVVALLNLVERLLEENRRLLLEGRRLKDEVARLKGEQGRPKVNPQRGSDPAPKPPADHSSEAERRERKPWQKSAKLPKLVLSHPELPLHNNAAELAVRRRVRQRDVSFGPRSAAGARAWDTFQSLCATCAKLGVSFHHYLHDRITSAGRIPRLADLIEERARTLDLGRSWAHSPAPSY